MFFLLQTDRSTKTCKRSSKNQGIFCRCFARGLCELQLHVYFSDTKRYDVLLNYLKLEPEWQAKGKTARSKVPWTTYRCSLNKDLIISSCFMSSVSMPLDSFACKIPDNNLSSAHIISDISLGKRQQCCEQSGAIHISNECMCSLWQGCCSQIVFVKAESCWILLDSLFYPTVFDTSCGSFIIYLSFKCGCNLSRNASD